MVEKSLSRRRLLSTTAAFAVVAPFASSCAGPDAAKAPGASGAAEAIETMKRATAFMTDTVSREGGYVWSYLPDFSRSWGEMEAFPTSVWIQPPGTPSMGHVFLDAYHATGDEQFYAAAEETAACLDKLQHPEGGWNYLEDLAGEASLRRWYDEIGENGWRLEEFQHYYGNSTFDDEGTSEASIFFLRMFAEKQDARWRPPLEKALNFVLDSQYPVGGWPQRYPLRDEFHHHGLPDYTSFITFNDDVTSGNLKFMLLYHQYFGDDRVLDPIRRAMDCFLVTQQKGAQPVWGLQHDPVTLKPAGARTYEPKAFVTHTTAANIQQLMLFYELTGDKKYLARIPEALDWLDKVKLPAALAAETGRTHPTFLEIGDDKPLYLHRRGSNVVNGEYYYNDNPHDVIAHYSSFRTVHTDALRARWKTLVASDPDEVSKNSPLKGGKRPLPEFFSTRRLSVSDLNTNEVGGTGTRVSAAEAATLEATLNGEGYWPTPLRAMSHPPIGAGSSTPAPGDFHATRVGDMSDTSPYIDEHPVLGVSTGAYIQNMIKLITFLKPEAAG